MWARGGPRCTYPSRTIGTCTTRPTTSSTSWSTPAGTCDSWTRWVRTSAGVTVAPRGRVTRATTTGRRRPRVAARRCSTARSPATTAPVTDREGTHRPSGPGARGTSEHGPAFREARRDATRCGKCGGSGGGSGPRVGGGGAQESQDDPEPEERRMTPTASTTTTPTPTEVTSLIPSPTRRTPSPTKMTSPTPRRSASASPTSTTRGCRSCRSPDPLSTMPAGSCTFESSSAAPRRRGGSWASGRSTARSPSRRRTSRSGNGTWASVLGLGFRRLPVVAPEALALSGGDC